MPTPGMLAPELSCSCPFYYRYADSCKHAQACLILAGYQKHPAELLSKKSQQPGGEPALSTVALRAAKRTRKRVDELDWTHLGASGRLVRLSPESIARRMVKPPTPLKDLSRREAHDLKTRVMGATPAELAVLARALATWDGKCQAYSAALRDAEEVEKAERDAAAAKAVPGAPAETTPRADAGGTDGADESSRAASESGDDSKAGSTTTDE